MVQGLKCSLFLKPLLNPSSSNPPLLFSFALCLCNSVARLGLSLLCRDFRIKMSSVVSRFLKNLILPSSTNSIISSSVGLQRNSRFWYSNASLDNNGGDDVSDVVDVEDDDFITVKKDLEPQGVDPRRGWGFRGVHKAFICGKIGQAPVQKILRNGKTVTIFTVGTGGMYDQRIVGAENLPKPAQWHRIAIHNEEVGAYAVQQLVKGSPVFVEGDIETRVYNDSISGEVKNVPEICVRRDGKVRLIKTGESAASISLDDLKDGLL